jgi:hypothetical protein
MKTDGSDLEKLYTRDIDDFLNDSDWDVESIAPSNVSYQSTRSQFDGKLRGLESIYLQRLESTLGKRQAALKARKPKKPKFRNLQDRFVNDPELMMDDKSEKDDLSSLIHESKKFGAPGGP